MAKISEVINKLQKLKKEKGNIEIEIYNNVRKITFKVEECEIYDEIEFDDIFSNVYVGICYIKE